MQKKTSQIPLKDLQKEEVNPSATRMGDILKIMLTIQNFTEINVSENRKNRCTFRIVLDLCLCGKHMKKQNKTKQDKFDFFQLVNGFRSLSFDSSGPGLALAKCHNEECQVQCIYSAPVGQKERTREGLRYGCLPFHYRNCVIHWRLSFCLMIWEEGIWNPN